MGMNEKSSSSTTQHGIKFTTIFERTSTNKQTNKQKS
jgi:hypothetical protein